MTAIACRDLFRVHRTAEGDATALQGLSLTAEAGEIVAVLGPSGSGKSTLLRILAGLERPSAGAAVVLGHDMGRLGARDAGAVRRRLIGMVDQHAERVLPPDLPVRDAVALALRVHGERRAPARAQADDLLAGVGLSDMSSRLPGELSGGERQRAAVCVAVAHEPAVVLADEPTGELDAAAAEEVLAILAGLARRGSTVLLVTHDPHATERADRVVRIRDGRVSEEGEGPRRAVVIAPGGWLRVPPELLESAGISGRARVTASSTAVTLEPVGDRAEPAPGRVPQEARPAAGAPRRGLAVALVSLTKRYGRRTVLDGLSAEFAPGRFAAVTGRSGSGKSTLLHLIAGLDRPDSGEVRCDGDPIVGLSRAGLAALRARDIGMVSQDPFLAPFLSAAEHLVLAMAIAGVDRREAAARAHEWLGVVGLSEAARRHVGRLSAGEQQRVAVARALAGDRRLILLDEPTSRLDAASAERLAALLGEAARVRGVTIVCATHDPIVREQADSVLSLDPAEQRRP